MSIVVDEEKTSALFNHNLYVQWVFDPFSSSYKGRSLAFSLSSFWSSPDEPLERREWKSPLLHRIDDQHRRGNLRDQSTEGQVIERSLLSRQICRQCHGLGRSLDRSKLEIRLHLSSSAFQCGGCWDIWGTRVLTVHVSFTSRYAATCQCSAFGVPLYPASMEV